MRQRIEKKRKTKPCEVEITVMFHDVRRVLGGNDSFHALEIAAPSLSWLLVVDVAFATGASSLSADLSSPTDARSSCHQTRRRALMQTEKFSAEEPVARSALAVFAVSPNTRSTQAASTVIAPMTEQRRCAAA